MSDEEFLKRWSRRKQEATQNAKAAEPAPPSPAAEAEDAAVTGSPQAPETKADLSKLPSIDSITAATDITEFLREGIPAELSRAALRRAWAADPAIRDFVGLAENAWDFTDPNAMPGFGVLQGTPEQIGAMVERVLGGARDTLEKLASEPPETEEQRKSGREREVSASAETLESVDRVPPPCDTPAEPIAAVQPEASNEDGGAEPVRWRPHGGALPS